MGGMLKRITRKTKRAVKIGVAAGKLGARVTNPINIAKTTINAARGKGLVLPGSKYIGPGNSMDRGPPTSKADAAAYQHDLDYDRLLKKGISPSKLYLGYSDADARLRKRSDVTTPDGLATYAGMSVKKGLQKLGLTGSKIKEHPHPTISRGAKGITPPPTQRRRRNRKKSKK